MKPIWKTLAALTLILCLFITAGLTERLGDSAPQPTSFSLKKTYASIDAGETFQLEARFYPSGADSRLTWTSNDPSIATVDQNGLVTGQGEGSAVITAVTENGLSDTASITVRLPDLEAIELSHTGVETVIIGKTLTLTAKPVPALAYYKPTWVSSDEAVATVSEDGVVTGVGAGTATITVRSFPYKGSGYYASLISAELTVKVVPPEATKVVLKPGKTISLYLGKTRTLKATVKPALAVQTVEWSSSRPKIATVDENGKVTPLKKGSTVITAKAENGVFAKVKVNVLVPKPTRVTLDAEGTVYLQMKKKMTLHADVAPEQAEKKFTWTSSDPSVAKVDKKGRITGVKPGKADITVKTANGKKDKVTICVYDPKKPDSVSIQEGKSKKIRVGMMLNLTAVQDPAPCTSQVTWKSSDPKVVSVSRNGSIQALKPGKAVVTVTTKNKKSASIKIDVQRNIADNLRDKPGYWVVSYGQEIYLKSVEIVSPTRVDCEYYLVFNHITGLTTTRFAYIKDRITADGVTIVDGQLENIKIRLASPGVKLFKVSYTGKAVKDTNVDLNAKRKEVYGSDSFWLEWVY